MNIFQVLKTSGAIVGADQDQSVIVTWNGASTFNVLDVNNGCFFYREAFQNYEVRSIEEAETVAKEHLQEI